MVRNLLLLLALVPLLRAEWTRVHPANAGATGQIVSHGDAVIVYGYQGGPVAWRSTDGGGQWTEIGAGLPANLSRIISWQDSLYACALGSVYSSRDNGSSWQVKSTVTVTGNGALVGFCTSGEVLYAHSNRKSVFRSTNHGLDWEETVIDDPRNLVMMDFEAVGDTWLANFSGTGAMVSTDGGGSWQDHNPPTATSSLGSDGQYLYGLTFAGEFYRMDPATAIWSPAGTGLPAGLRIHLSLLPWNGGLLLHSYNLIGGAPQLSQSLDHAHSWSPLEVAGLPDPWSMGSLHFLAGTSDGLFCYGYSALQEDRMGVFHLPLQTVVAPPATRPRQVRLVPAWPNPFNPDTRLAFELDGIARVRLAVYNLKGQEVALLADGEYGAGRHALRFDGGALPSGLYLARLESGSTVRTTRLLLVR